MKITVFSLARDDDFGTSCQVYATESEAVQALLKIVDWTQEDETDYSRAQMERFYFFPDEIPEPYEDWYEMISERKSSFDTYNIDEHTLEVKLPITVDK